MGWTVDFGDVKALFKPIFKMLDHQPLHEIADLADCDAASLAHWILHKARVVLPQVDRVDLYETRGCGALAWWARKFGAADLTQRRRLDQKLKPVPRVTVGE